MSQEIEYSVNIPEDCPIIIPINRIFWNILEEYSTNIPNMYIEDTEIFTEYLFKIY